MEKIVGRFGPRWGLVGVCGVLVVLVLAGCGTSANAGGASATATATCPPTAPTRNTQTARGTISAVASGTITVAESSGTSVTVHLDATTRITKLVKAQASALAAGTRVQVVTDASVTTAQQIVITTGQGFGGGGGRGAGSGTPTAGFNRACFQRQGQGAGQGGGQGGRFGLAGVVASVSSTQLVVNDAQGQALTVAITPATAIETMATGHASDLAVGASVLVTGLKASDGITARTIALLSAG